MPTSPPVTVGLEVILETVREAAPAYKATHRSSISGVGFHSQQNPPKESLVYVIISFSPALKRSPLGLGSVNTPCLVRSQHSVAALCLTVGA
jgi:hypothetical protein